MLFIFWALLAEVNAGLVKRQRPVIVTRRPPIATIAPRTSTSTSRTSTTTSPLRSTSSTLSTSSTSSSTSSRTTSSSSSSSQTSASSSSTSTSTSASSRSSRASSSAQSSGSASAASAICIRASLPTSAPRAVPPAATIFDYGSMTSQFSNTYRDGGGGVTLNGFNLMVFSDTYTTIGNFTSSLRYFVGNSFTYADTTSDPRYFQDFGTLGPNQQVNTFLNETGVGGRYVVWPSQNLILGTANGQSVAFGVMPVAFNYLNGLATTAYNTLVQVTADANGPTATRIVQALFYDGEPQYGTGGMYSGPDGYTYLFAYDTTGVKAARVNATGLSIADRTQYQYYRNGTWCSNIPSLSDASANIFTWSANYFGTFVGPASGEIFFSPYHNTLLFIFFDGFVDGLYRVAYSLDGTLDNWSQPVDLYQSAQVPASFKSWNYAAHVYPMMDPSGNTLTMTYTYGGNYINRVKTTWCDPATCRTTSSGFVGGP